MSESWLVVLEAWWASFWDGNIICSQDDAIEEDQMLFCDRSVLSLIAKFYEGAEEMAVRMWAKKLVKPVDNGVKLAPA